MARPAGDGFIRLKRSTGQKDPTNADYNDPVQYVELPNQPDPSALTISVWARHPKSEEVAPSSTGMLVWFGSDGDGHGGLEGSETIAPHHELWLRRQGVHEDGLRFRMSIGFTPSYLVDMPAYSIPAPTPPPSEVPSCFSNVYLNFDDWHHVALTVVNLQSPNGAHLVEPLGNYTLYINGVKHASAQGSYTVNTERFRSAFLGRSELLDNPHSWMGEVDDFMMFDRVLSDAEVRALYEAQL